MANQYMVDASNIAGQIAAAMDNLLAAWLLGGTAYSAPQRLGDFE